MATIYERDLVLWAKDTAQLLREKHWEAIDLYQFDIVMREINGIKP